MNPWLARRERLRRPERVPEEADATRAHAELCRDRGHHRRRIATRRATRLMVGLTSQPAGEDAAARSLPCRRLCRDENAGRQQRAVSKVAAGQAAYASGRGPV